MYMYSVSCVVMFMYVLVDNIYTLLVYIVLDRWSEEGLGLDQNVDICFIDCNKRSSIWASFLSVGFSCEYHCKDWDPTLAPAFRMLCNHDAMHIIFNSCSVWLFFITYGVYHYLHVLIVIIFGSFILDRIYWWSITGVCRCWHNFCDTLSKDSPQIWWLGSTLSYRDACAHVYKIFQGTYIFNRIYLLCKWMIHADHLTARVFPKYKHSHSSN